MDFNRKKTIMLNFINKVKATARLIFRHKKYTSQKSYYPEEPHKSKWHVFKDQLFFIWKYGNTEKYYFAYGFDRKCMSLKKMCEDYIINESAFMKKMDFHNDHPGQNMFPGRCIISDKFYFYLFLNSLNIPTPKVFYYTRNGKLFYGVGKDKEGIENVFSIDIDAFAKPFGGQMGDGAFALKVKDSLVYVDGKLCSQIDDLIQTISKTDYVIQERVIQHPQLNKLCSTAVNTIRLLTLITPDQDVIAFRAGLRIGREGSSVDNCAKGGIFVGIDMNTGRLLKKGIIKPPYGNTVYQHPDNGVVFEGFEIPYFKEAVEMAKELHSKLYRIHSVGWDIAISPDGPIFIEGNSRWEVSGTQAAVGGLKFIEKYFD